MKKFLKFIGIFLLLLIIAGAVFYFIENEPLPKGEKGENAEALAEKMFDAINHEAFENAEILEWSFRNEHDYNWYKQQGKVEVSWDENKVILNTKNPTNSTVFVDGNKVNNPDLIETAKNYFNNDSFWLVAPYKIFDAGTERAIVNYEGKDALLVTYTSGGSTPGDSYLWILDNNYKPVSYKMWAGILPVGGVSATWDNLKKTEAGVLLPKDHKLSLFGLEIPMGNVKAYNQKANEFADKILAAIKHEAYENTAFIAWSFGGRRNFVWDKKNHFVDVSWEDFKVNLHPDNLEKSTVFFEGVKQEDTDEQIVKRAWDIFNNDSFWLVAPHKLYDDGVIRNLVKEDGKDALKVTYTKGGTTPGDSYIWFVDENYIPKSYKMFVPSMKMNGVPATWEDWITTESGTLLPTNHVFSNSGNLSMGEVKGYNK